MKHEIAWYGSRFYDGAVEKPVRRVFHVEAGTHGPGRSVTVRTMRAASLLLCALLPLGCVVSPSGALAPAIAPTIMESYEVRGVVQSDGLVVQPLRGVRVRVYYRGELLAEAETDLTGHFMVRADGSHPAAGGGANIGVLFVQVPTNSDVVQHYFGGKQGHKHFNVNIVVAEEGFEEGTATVDIPRAIDAEPIEIRLKPVR